MTENDLELLVAAWKGGDWTACIAGTAIPQVSPNDKAVKLLAEKIEYRFGKGQLGRAYNWTLLALRLSKGAVLRSGTVAGVFQPGGRSQARRTATVKVLKRLEATMSSWAEHEAERRLSSWRAYNELAISLERVRDHLFERVIGDPYALHVAAIALEESFSEDSPDVSEIPGRERVSDLIREELADAFSYILAVLAEKGHLSLLSLPPFLRHEDLNAEREQILIDAYRLRELHAAEPAVFRLGYRCEHRSDGTFALAPPDDRFGMAMSFGYLKSRQMSMIPPDQWNESDAPIFDEMCRGAVTRFAKDFASVATDPVRRLVLKFPEPVLRIMGEKFLLTRGLYREDIWHTRDACYEMGVTADDLDTFEVAPGMTLMDLLVVVRVFRFIHLFRRPPMVDLRDTDPVAYLNSVIMKATRSDHVDRLAACGLDTGKAQAFVDLLTWSVSAGHLDVQYTPIVDLGITTAVFMSVLAKSNIIRNSLLTARKRLNDDGVIDPVSDAVAAAFRQRTKYVWTKFQYRTSEVGDVDVLVLLGDYLFAFECKNTLLPCSEFEQRTLIDYITKGAAQLDKFRTVYSDPTFQAEASRRLGVALPPVANLRTGIVLSNRLLSGAHFLGHPVRHVHELANLVTDGTGRMHSPMTAEPLTISLWRGQAFSPDVVAEYLEEGSAMYEPIWAAMERSAEALDVGPVRVERAKYGLNVGPLIHNLARAGFIDPGEHASIEQPDSAD